MWSVQFPSKLIPKGIPVSLSYSNQLLNVFVCSSVAPTAAKKRKITQRLLTLSVEHQFVTPVTALLVESEDGPERLLADSPRDPRQGCCPGAGITITITTTSTNNNNNHHQHQQHLYHYHHHHLCTVLFKSIWQSQYKTVCFHFYF